MTKRRFKTMTYPKKAGRRTRAMRRIVVDGRVYRWRLQPGYAQSVLTLAGPMSSGQPLHVILRGWRDPWLNIAGFVVDESGALNFSTRSLNEPAIITPRFARQAILHGLASGWRPHERGPKLFCIHERGKWSELSRRPAEVSGDIDGNVRTLIRQRMPC